MLFENEQKTMWKKHRQKTGTSLKRRILERRKDEARRIGIKIIKRKIKIRRENSGRVRRVKINRWEKEWKNKERRVGEKTEVIKIINVGIKGRRTEECRKRYFYWGFLKSGN